MPRSTSNVIWRAQSWQEAKEALAATRDVHRAQRERFAAMGNPSAHPLHGILREGGGVAVTVDDDIQPVLGPPPERAEQD